MNSTWTSLLYKYMPLWLHVVYPLMLENYTMFKSYRVKFNIKINTKFNISISGGSRLDIVCANMFWTLCNKTMLILFVVAVTRPSKSVTPDIVFCPTPDVNYTLGCVKIIILSLLFLRFDWLLISFVHAHMQWHWSVLLCKWSRLPSQFKDNQDWCLRCKQNQWCQSSIFPKKYLHIM